MIGVIDESTPWLDLDTKKLIYALAMVVGPHALLESASQRLRARLNRRRPFHWEADTGPVVRGIVLDELCNEGLQIVVAAAVCGPSTQTAVRRHLIEERLLPVAFELGVEALVIERQSRSEDDVDKRSIRNRSRQQHRWRPEVNHVDKSDSRTWLADAASGLWSDALLGRDRHDALGRISAARTARALMWEP